MNIRQKWEKIKKIKKIENLNLIIFCHMFYQIHFSYFSLVYEFYKTYIELENQPFIQFKYIKIKK